MPEWSRIAPSTEAALHNISADQLAIIAALDADRLALERSRLPPEFARRLTEPGYSVENRLRFWERLIRRMENNWDPDGYYAIEEYANDLESRTQLDVVTASSPALLDGPIGDLIHKLDCRFIAVTIPDREDELHAPWLAERTHVADRWKRIPLVIPWSSG